MISVPFDSPYSSAEVGLFEWCGHVSSVPQQEGLIIAVWVCVCVCGYTCVCVCGVYVLRLGVGCGGYVYACVGCMC